MANIFTDVSDHTLDDSKLFGGLGVVTEEKRNKTRAAPQQRTVGRLVNMIPHPTNISTIQVSTA